MKTSTTRKKKIEHSFTSQCILEALQTVHPGPEKWTLLEQVPDGTSYNKSRTADAMAFGCWSSEGICIHGYEIKVSRSDWLKEIQQPEKSRDFETRCNYWWVAAPEGIVELAEMPATWGLRTVAKTDAGFMVKVRKAATFNPNPVLTVGFLSAAIRCAFKRSPERRMDDKAIRDAHDQGYKEGEDYGKREHHREIDRLTKRIAKLEEDIELFRQQSGIQIKQLWRNGNIGQAVRAFQDLGRPEEIYSDVAKTLERLLAQLRPLLKIESEPEKPKPIEIADGWEDE